MEGLDPCCGSPDLRIDPVFNEDLRGAIVEQEWFVRCANCDDEGPLAWTKEGAKEAWNYYREKLKTT